MTDSSPSEASRELVRGAYDLHIHVAPDVMTRRISDIEVARRFVDVGMAGFALKSHYLPTSERAQVVKAVVAGVDVLGSITLNASVGGINPIAVELAARSGARIVWMPTVDARNERDCVALAPPGAKPPMWAQIQQELRDAGIDAAPVEVLDDEGEVREDVRRVLKLIASHNLVLATGHLSSLEIHAVVRCAVEVGVSSVIVTHPEFTSQRLSLEDQRILADKGAFLERCFTTPHTGKTSWRQMFEAVRATGPEHSFFSSDLGQPFNPPVEDGLALMADQFLNAGFTEAEVYQMAVTNSSRLANSDLFSGRPAPPVDTQHMTLER